MFKIQKIQLKALSGFIKSDQFLGFENKPISSLRALSYLNNPNANQDDIVLYMAFDADVLVGYRTIWRDKYWLFENSKSFGWLSGNWVHKDYRRKGVSTTLFNEVYKDWDAKLMFTNYALNSKLLYDKTGHFTNIKSLVGTRFYTRFCLSEILIPKHKIFLYLKFILIILDFFFNLLLDFRFLFLRKTKIKSEIRKDENWTNEIELFLKDFKKKELFKRDLINYQWIKNFPWITSNKDFQKESSEYYFSLYTKDFQSNYYTFYNKKDELTAFVWLSFRDGHLKIPYVYFKKESENEVVNFLLNKVIEEKVKTVLVYHQEIEKELNKKLFCITKKTFYQNFFATNNLELDSNSTKKMKIQSGNGDVIFT